MNDTNNQNNQNQWDDANMQSTGLTDSSKGNQGFKSMPAEKRSQIAAKGGTVAHQKGTAHEWNSKEAAEAGRKGGQNSRANRKTDE